MTLSARGSGPSRVELGIDTYPEFDVSIHDYVARCDGPFELTARPGAGERASIADSPFTEGPLTRRVRRTAGERVKVTFRTDGPASDRTYSVRCLPRDFPVWTFDRERRPLRPFYLFQTGMLDHGGYMAIYNRRGTPVWWMPAPSPVFTGVFSDNTITRSRFPGPRFAENRDRHFERFTLAGRHLRSVRGKGGPIDPHDIQRLPDGNFMAMVLKVRKGIDLTRFGGPPNAFVLGIELEEITPSGKVVWTWNNRGHIGLEETGRWWPSVLGNTTKIGKGRVAYDIGHPNSIDANRKSVIISFRHNDAVYRIDRRTGGIVWKLGGTPTPESLKVSGPDPFRNYPLAGQHDARAIGHGLLSIHDNGAELNRPPRGVAYRIDARRGTARFIGEQREPGIELALGIGSATYYRGGGWLLNIGNSKYATEYDAAGERTFRFSQFFRGSSVPAYRATAFGYGRFRPEQLRRAMDGVARNGGAG